MVDAMGVEVSPKGVTDMDVSMETVVEKIRERREAVLEGRVKPSFGPKFPSPPVRRTLISIDDEEVKTYRVEITTDNVVQQSVPARFSRSEAEEYLAEFDMVDTQGEIVSPQTTKIAATPATLPAVKQKKSGRFSPFLYMSGSQDSSSLKEPKKSEKSADGMRGMKTGGPLSSLRKRTFSSEDAEEAGVEANASLPSQEYTPPRAEKELVENLQTPPSRETIITQPAKTPLQSTDNESSTPKYAGNEATDVTLSPSQTRGVFFALRKRRHSPQRGQERSPESGKPTPPQDKNAMYAEPPAEWDSAIESSREEKKGDMEPTPEEAKEQSPVQVPTESLTEVEAKETPTVDATKAAPETTRLKPAKPQEDDTVSITTSSNESLVIKPPTTFPGEAVVEGLLEKFFDKVTCACINDKCVIKDEEEVPVYMVVEIQKIHQKAQAKKAEIAEKKQARRSKKIGKPSRSSSKKSTKEKEESAKNKVSSTSEQKPSSPERKGVPTYEWGEKVLEQDSVTTASLHQQLSPGVTVGEFFRSRFGMLKKSLRGKEEEPASEERQGADVDESESEPEKDHGEVAVDSAILNITAVKDRAATESAPSNGTFENFAAIGGVRKVPKETVIVLSAADEVDGSESLLDAADDGDSLMDEDESEYTTELIQVEFDPSKLGNTTDADMYLAREVLRRYAEITGISLDELIEDVVDESLASLTLDAYGFPANREEEGSASSSTASF